MAVFRCTRGFGWGRPRGRAPPRCCGLVVVLAPVYGVGVAGVSVRGQVRTGVAGDPDASRGSVSAGFDALALIAKADTVPARVRARSLVERLAAAGRARHDRRRGCVLGRRGWDGAFVGATFATDGARPDAQLAFECSTVLEGEGGRQRPGVAPPPVGLRPDKCDVAARCGGQPTAIGSAAGLTGVRRQRPGRHHRQKYLSPPTDPA